MCFTASSRKRFTLPLKTSLKTFENMFAIRPSHSEVQVPQPAVLSEGLGHGLATSACEAIGSDT